jgi:hypothetical protein
MSQGFTIPQVLDTDGALAANSDYVAPSEKAVKTYIDAHDLSASDLAETAAWANGGTGTHTAVDLHMNYHVLPVGIGWNYKIVPSVASNNLTVALKGLDGNDASATNPIKVRIGNVERTITAALSVTKNAGTNWCNSGGVDLATKEIDYFVYLGYNATDGVVIGFSRIPYANLYSDFSATTTAETYAAISTIANAAAGNDYVNIGRFAATLSATAAFNWSVPTFTTANLVNKPIYESRWLTWTVQYAGWSANPTYNQTYQINNRMISYDFAVTGNGTSNATTATMSLPFKAAVADFCALIGYQDNSVVGAPGDIQTAAASNLLSLYKTVYSGGWTAANVKVMYIPLFSIRLI